MDLPLRRLESDVQASREWAGMILDSIETGAPVTASAIASLPALATALRAFGDEQADALAVRLDAHAATLEPDQYL